jgi:hypothetical protein
MPPLSHEGCAHVEAHMLAPCMAAGVRTCPFADPQVRLHAPLYKRAHVGAHALAPHMATRARTGLVRDRRGHLRSPHYEHTRLGHSHWRCTRVPRCLMRRILRRFKWYDVLQQVCPTSILLFELKHKFHLKINTSNYIIFINQIFTKTTICRRFSKEFFQHLCIRRELSRSNTF